MGLIDFEGNHCFGVVLCFQLLWFLGKGWMVNGFRDLEGFHSSFTLDGYLESLWFRGFLNV